jgi:hypothetical protein
MTSEFKKLAKICDSAVIRTEGGQTDISLIFRLDGKAIDRLPIITEGKITTHSGDLWVTYKVNGITTSYTGEKPRKCFAHVGCCRLDNYWQTLVQSIKTTDTIQVVWVLANNSQLLNDRNLFFDSCEIVLKRGKNQLHFPVAQQVSLQNSARMAQV